MAVDAIINLSKFTGSTGKFLYSIFLESRSVLEAKFVGAYNTSIGASKYIKIVKNHYPANFQNFVIPLKLHRHTDAHVWFTV